jgi:hypothetical protein
MRARLPRAPMGYAVLPPSSLASGPQLLLLCKFRCSINHTESTLLQVFFLKNLKAFEFNTYEKQGEGSPLWSTNCSKKVSPAAHCVPAHQASLSVDFTHFQLFHLPLFPSALRPRASARQLVFHLPYTLPSSVSRKSFICRSYENTGGVGVFFPFWNCSRFCECLGRGRGKDGGVKPPLQEKTGLEVVSGLGGF